MYITVKHNKSNNWIRLFKHCTISPGFQKTSIRHCNKNNQRCWLFNILGLCLNFLFLSFQRSFGFGDACFYLFHIFYFFHGNTLRLARNGG